MTLPTFVHTAAKGPRGMTAPNVSSQVSVPSRIGSSGSGRYDNSIVAVKKLVLVSEGACAAFPLLTTNVAEFCFTQACW